MLGIPSFPKERPRGTARASRSRRLPGARSCARRHPAQQVPHGVERRRLQQRHGPDEQRHVAPEPEREHANEVGRLGEQEVALWEGDVVEEREEWVEGDESSDPERGDDAGGDERPAPERAAAERAAAARPRPSPIDRGRTPPTGGVLL